MKTLVIYLFTFTISISSIFSQGNLPYQGVLKDAQGAIVPNKQIALRFSIKNQANVLRYQEIQKPTTDKNGWFEVLIGTGTLVSGSYNSINWSETNSLVMECSANDDGNFEEVASGIIQGAPFANSGDKDPSNDITNGSPAGGDLKGTYPNPGVKNINGKPVSDNNPNVGEVLKWNGSQWAPALDNTSGGSGTSGVNSIISGQGISINNSDPKNPIIVNAGDLDKTNELQELSIQGNLLSISQRNSVTIPGDNWGGQTVQANATLSGNGTASNPMGLAAQGATNGQVLKWNGSSWAPANESTNTNSVSLPLVGNGSSSNPIAISTTNANYGDILQMGEFAWEIRPFNAYTDNSTLTGNGRPSTPIKLAQQNAINGQVLKWNGTSWTPANDNSGNSLWMNQGNNIYYNLGNVGIGTSTPSQPLHINGNARIDDKLIFGAGGSITSSSQGISVLEDIIPLGSKPSLGSPTQKWYDVHFGQTYIEVVGSDLNPISNNIYNLGSESPTLRWKNVNISNSINFAPGKFLSNVSAGISSGDDFVPYTNNTYDLGSGSLRWRNVNVSNAIDFAAGKFLSSVTNAISSGDDFIPFTDGNLLLGSSSNRWKEVWATDGTINTSDRNSKKNIVASSYGLNEVMKLKPSQYYWKDERFSKEKQIGFIAQDLLEIIPEAVVTTESQYDPETKESKIVPVQNLGIKYDLIIPVVTKAIQEQQDMIEELKVANGKLVSDIDQLKAYMEKELASIKEAIAKKVKDVSKNSD